jgi:thioredoxin reductase
MQKLVVIIIGAGAAGLMCAAEAHKRRRWTLLLERGAKLGQNNPHFPWRAPTSPTYIPLRPTIYRKIRAFASQP